MRDPAGRRRRSESGRNAERVRREVEEELQHHLELKKSRLMSQGAGEAEARAQAEREFGDLDDAMRYCMEVGMQREQRRRMHLWWNELQQDATHALRLLRRAPAFAAATILVLGVAAGATTAAYGMLSAYALRPLPFPRSEDVMWVQDARNRTDRFERPSTENVDWHAVQAQFDAAATWDLDGFTLVGDQPAESVMGSWVPAGFFDLFGLRTSVGRAFTEEEYRQSAAVALISHGLWVRRFGADPDVIGTAVMAHSNDRPLEPALVTIVGVLPREYWSAHWPDTELLRPMPAENVMPNLVRLRAGESKESAERRLDAAVRAQIAGEIHPSWRMTLVPAVERHAGGVRPVLTAILGAALFILLAACANVAGVLVSRTSARHRELALRAALGGSRARIVRQMLTESAVLSTLAGLVGLAFACLLTGVAGPLIEAQLGTDVPGGAAALRPTASAMLGALLAASLAGAVLGLVPALQSLRSSRIVTPAGASFGTRGAARAGGARARRILIGAQVTITLVLLFGAGLMARTVGRIADTDLGFRTAGVMMTTLLLPESRYPDRDARRRGMDELLATVLRVNGVRGAAAVFPLPFTWPNGFPVAVGGSEPDPTSSPRANVYTVSPGYLEAMDIPVHAGRLFAETDDDRAQLVALVSESLALQLYPDGDAIGRSIRVRVPHVSNFSDPDSLPARTIIGVVGDTRESFASAVRAPVPDVYVPYAQNPRATIGLAVRTDGMQPTAVKALRDAVMAFDESLALSSLTSVADLVGRQSARQRGLGVVLAGFAAFALLLSALALYAALSWIVLQRRGELAVRLAMGAPQRSILRLVVGEGLATTAFGLIAGILLSLGLGRILAGQLFGVSAHDPVTLLLTAAILTGTAVVACALPSLRAARTDPALVLRE